MFAQEGCQLFVGDLNENVNEQILYTEFGKYGAVTSVRVMKHILTKKSRGHAFITFRSPKMAELARAKMNGAEILGCRVRVMLKGENRNENRDAIVYLSNVDTTLSFAVASL